MTTKCKGNCGKILNPNKNKSGWCSNCQRGKYFKKWKI